MPPHKISPGDCLNSIALSKGVAFDVIWRAPGNAELRRVREAPNVLATGDLVDVPARATKRVSVRANARHVVQLNHTHVTLRVRLEAPDGPLRNAALAAFQRDAGLAVTGELDTATTTALRDRHGS